MTRPEVSVALHGLVESIDRDIARLVADPRAPLGIATLSGIQVRIIRLQSRLDREPRGPDRCD